MPHIHIDSMEESRSRFYDKVDKSDTCWLWTTYISQSGYGYFWYDGKDIRAHRFSYLLEGNTIPDGHIVRHICRNRHCVRPEHLETGTYSENNGEDKIRDGTAMIGERHHKCRLTTQQVLAIRANPLNKSKAAMSREYGVGPSQIQRILNRETWTHI